MSRLPRILTGLLALVGSVATVTVLAGYALLGTTPGARWALERALPEATEVASVEGRLLGPLWLRGVSVPLSGLEMSVDSLGIDWRPGRLLRRVVDVSRLEVAGVRIRSAASPGDERPAAGPPGLTLPLPVLVRRADVRRVTVMDKNADTAATLAAARLTGGMGPDGVRIDSLRVRGLAAAGVDGEARLEGRIGGAPPHSLRATVRWSGRLPDGRKLRGSGALAGELEEIHVEHRLTHPVVADADATVRDVFGDPRWTAALDVPEVALQSVDPSLPELGVRVTARADGDGESARARLSFHVTPPGEGSLPGELSLTWSPGRLAVDSATLRIPSRDGTFVARGSVELDSDDPLATVRTEWSNLAWPLSGEPTVASSRGGLELTGRQTGFDFALDASARGAGSPPSGWRVRGSGARTGDSLRARASVRTDVEGVPPVRTALRATLRPGGVSVHEMISRFEGLPTRLRALGNLRTGSGPPRADLRIEWEDLRWPFSGEATYASRQGALELDGTLERARLRARAALGGASIPEGMWRVVGTATREGLVADTIRAEILGGRVSGEAVAAWTGGVGGSVALEGFDLNPAHFRSEWPGSLGLSLTASGAWGGDEPHVAVEELSLEGDLRDRPFTARARGELRAAELRADTIFVRSRTATVEGTAVVADEVDASLRIDAPDLLDLLPGASGRLLVHGRATGPRTAPRVRLSAEGSGLAHADLRADSLLAEIAVDLSDSRPSGGEIRARELRYGTVRLDSLRVEAAGRAGDHTITMTAGSGGERGVAGVHGGWNGSAWRGALTRLDLETSRAGRWDLADPGAVFVSRDSASLDRSCWSGDEGRLCLAGSWTSDSYVRWDATGQGLPLAFLEPSLPPALSLDGWARLETRGRLGAGSSPDVDLRVEADSAALRYRVTGQEERRRPIDALRVEARADASETRGSAELRFADGDHLRLEVDSGPLDAGTSSLRARVTGDLQDRGLAEALSSYALMDTRGRVRIDLSATGTRSRPVLVGSVRLEGAGAVVPDLGIRITDVGLDARKDADDSGVWRIGGAAASGRGTATLEGTFRLPMDPAGWSLEASLTGQEFEAYRTSFGHFLLSPELRILLDEQRADVVGELGVPVGRIAAAALPSAVPSAPDILIVGTSDASEQDPSALSAIPVSARIRVVLGRDVGVDAEGLRAELGGELTVLTEPGRAPVANGTLEIRQGSYSAYGQRLTIDRGRLVYVQSPLDDPALDLRIVRQSRGVTARMDVSGTVRQPRIALSSDPTLADEEILAYLLLGRPVNQLSQSEGRIVENVARSLGLRGGNLVIARLGALFGLQEARIEARGSISDASLVLGKQVLPRVQVDYAIGLLGTTNVLRIRYTLGRGWSIQTESGDEQSVDLLYEIGR